MYEILPLALTMVIGPQILTPILLLTGKDVIKPSLAYIVGVAIASTVGTLFFVFLANFFNWNSIAGGDSEGARIVQTILIVLLIIAAIHSFATRKTAEVPKWMMKLQKMTPKGAIKIAFLLFFLMPTDIIAMATVGINLASTDASYAHIVPFISLTTFFVSIPILSYGIFHNRMIKALPKIREWINTNSWMVSIFADVFFIFLLWN